MAYISKADSTSWLDALPAELPEMTGIEAALAKTTPALSMAERPLFTRVSGAPSLSSVAKAQL